MQKSKKHILFCLEGFLPNQRAGTELYVLQLCQILRKHNFLVSILISTTDPIIDYKYNDIPVYTFLVPKKPLPKELNGLIPPRGLRNFQLCLEKIRPDIIHFHSLGRAINSYHIQKAKNLGYLTVFTTHLGINVCLKGTFLKYNNSICNGKVVPATCLACKINDQGYPKLLSQFLGNTIIAFKSISNQIGPASYSISLHRKKELNRVNQYTDQVIAIAPWIKKALEINRMQNVQLVTQGISQNFANQINKKIPEQTGNHVKMAFFARMHPSKGFHLLKHALDGLDINNWELTILTMPSGGEDNYFSQAKVWAQSHKNINWHENIPHHQIPDYFNKIDLLVLPSISNEMAPLIILESFAMKVPVLGSSYPAITDMVKDDFNGIIFQNNNPDDLKQKLKAILSYPERLQRLSKRIQPVKTFDQVGLEMMKIYQDLITDRTNLPFHPSTNPGQNQ